MILAHTVRCCCETKYLAWAVWHQCLLCMFRQSAMLSAASILYSSCSQCSIPGRLRTILSYTVLCVTSMASNQLSKCGCVQSVTVPAEQAAVSNARAKVADGWPTWTSSSHITQLNHSGLVCLGCNPDTPDFAMIYMTRLHQGALTDASHV